MDGTVLAWLIHPLGLTSAKTLPSRAKCCDYSFNKTFCVLTAGSTHPSGGWVAGIIREQQFVILSWDSWFFPKKSWLTGPGRIKSWAAGRLIFCRFWTKRAKKGTNFNKIVSPLLSSLFIVKCPRNIVIFSLTQTNIVSFLKGQCHEIFDFCFFSWTIFPQAPEYTIKVV